ncbi:MAG: hypothetical protein J2P34_05065 [Actinobacteria bacterium]|nr:hypothetical protein [Actinomycetota bacterium]
MIRRLMITLAVPAMALLAALVAAAPAGADSGANCVGNSCTVGLGQFVQYRSSTGSVGTGAGYVPVEVQQPPCNWDPIGDATSGSQAIISEWAPNPPSNFQIDKSYAQAKKLLANPQPGTWYKLPVNSAASAAGQAECLQLPLYAFVPPGQAPPMPNIPGRILAEYAYNHMLIPPPSLVTNPASTGYVNLGTYVWQTAGAGQPLSVTAYVGNQSATVTATPRKLTISTDGPGTAYNDCGPQGSHSPQGNPPASAGPGVAPDCGVLWHGPASGATITATVTWTVTWSASDGNGGTLPVIRMQGQSAAIPVNEIQSVNGN